MSAFPSQRRRGKFAVVILLLVIVGAVASPTEGGVSITGSGIRLRRNESSAPSRKSPIGLAGRVDSQLRTVSRTFAIPVITGETAFAELAATGRAGNCLTTTAAARRNDFGADTVTGRDAAGDGRTLTVALVTALAVRAFGGADTFGASPAVSRSAFATPTACGPASESPSANATVPIRTPVLIVVMIVAHRAIPE